MASNTNIIIDGQSYDPNNLTLPATRYFRSAWTQSGGVVSVDIVEARQITHKLRAKWRAWAEQQPFVWNGTGGGKSFSSDRDSADRIQGELKAAEILHQRFVDDPVTYPTDYSLSPGWKSTDDTFVGPLFKDDLLDLFLTMRDHHLSVFTQSEVYRR